MSGSLPYVALSIVILGIVAILAVFISRKKKKAILSKLSAFSFFLIVAGIFWGENRFVGYGLIGIGIIFAVIDMVRKIKKITVDNNYAHGLNQFYINKKSRNL
jgi:hypothetical protein